MPDSQGNQLPPLPNEAFDGDKQQVKIENVKCNHKFNYITPREIRCIKCGLGYTDTPDKISEIKKLFDEKW